MSNMSCSESSIYQANKTIVDKFFSQSEGHAIELVGSNCLIYRGRYGRYLFDNREKRFIAKLSTDFKTLTTKQIETNPYTERLLDHLETEAIMRDLTVKQVIIPQSFSKEEAVSTKLNLVA